MLILSGKKMRWLVKRRAVGVAGACKDRWGVRLRRLADQQGQSRGGLEIVALYDLWGMCWLEVRSLDFMLEVIEDF